MSGCENSNNAEKAVKHQQGRRSNVVRNDKAENSGTTATKQKHWAMTLVKNQATRNKAHARKADRMKVKNKCAQLGMVEATQSDMDEFDLVDGSPVLGATLRMLEESESNNSGEGSASWEC